MTRPSVSKAAVVGGLLALGAVLIQLAREALTGGIESHHLLADPELPAISNAFGLILLPVLGALVGRRHARTADAPGRRRYGVLLGLGLAALYGLALAVSFLSGWDALAAGLFFALFALAVALPLYRAERLLGFTLGMSPALGPVLPVLVGGVVALVSLALHPLARHLLRRAVGRREV